MSNESRKNGNPKSFGQDEINDITTGDLVRFLRNFSSALRNARTGNPSMSIALSELALALQPYSGRHLQDVLSEFKMIQDSRETGEPTTSIQLADLELSSLTLESVKNLLDTSELTKKDIVNLGHTRFGIPKSRLERQNKAAVIDLVRTAVRNEESLRIIADEAARQGSRRST